MGENLEYQARFKADTSELRQMDDQLKQTGDQMAALSEAGTGLVVGLTGMKDAMKGSVSGLLAMAYGAGTAWKALAQLSPLLKGLALALAAAQAAQILWNHFSEKGKQKAEEQKRAVEELGLELSDLDKHSRAVDSVADSFDRVAKAADAAADAIKRVNDAQSQLNKAMAGAEMADLDLQEAKALNNPDLNDEQRRAIQRDFINRRADVAKRSAIEDFGSRAAAIENERAGIATEARLDSEKRAGLASAASTARDVLSSEISTIVEAIVQKESRVSSHDIQAAAHGVPMPPKAEDLRKQLLAEAANPEAFLKKHIGSLSTGDRDAIKGALENVGTREKELGTFDADAAIRQRDRQSRLDASNLAQQALGPGLAAALKSIEAARINGLADPGAGDSDAGADAMQRARDARDQYRFDNMSDTEKLSELDRRMGVTRDQIKSAGTPLERGELLQQLVDQQRQRDSVSESIDATKQARDREVGEHRAAIDELRNYRSTQATDTMQVFQHMYQVGAGKNPDEQVADHTKNIADHMAAIRSLLEESAA